MKPLLCALFFLGFWHTARADEIPDERLVRYCNAILLQDAGIGYWTDYPPHLVVRQLSARARHHFATCSFAQKRRELERVARLPLSAHARQSVAYVSAISGIQPYYNARRLIGYDYHLAPNRPLYPRMAGAGELIYGNVHNIYRKFPDRRIALLLLECSSDGAGATVARSVRFSMLEREPRFILALAMQSKAAFKSLSGDFSREGSEREFRVLRRLCSDRDPVLRGGARQIRHHVHAYRSRFKTY